MKRGELILIQEFSFTASQERKAWWIRAPLQGAWMMASAGNGRPSQARWISSVSTQWPLPGRVWHCLNAWQWPWASSCTKVRVRAVENKRDHKDVMPATSFRNAR
jgi:hypothetical protein